MIINYSSQIILLFYFVTRILIFNKFHHFNKFLNIIFIYIVLIKHVKENHILYFFINLKILKDFIQIIR